MVLLYRKEIWYYCWQSTGIIDMQIAIVGCNAKCTKMLILSIFMRSKYFKDLYINRQSTTLERSPARAKSGSHTALVF